MEEEKKYNIDDILAEYPENPDRKVDSDITIDDILKEYPEKNVEIEVESNVEENKEVEIKMEENINQEKSVDEIMEDYNKKIQEIDKQDIEEDKEIRRRKLHIERLKDERNEVNINIEKAVYEEYTKAIEEAEKELSEYKVKNAKSYDENKKQEIEKDDAKNVTIRELTSKGKELDKEIKRIEVQIKINSLEIDDFKYEYDENNRVINGQVMRKMLDLSYELKDTLKQLEDDKVKCEQYIDGLKKQFDKGELDAWKQMAQEQKGEVVQPVENKIEEKVEENKEKAETKKEKTSETKEQAEEKVEASKEDEDKKDESIEDKIKNTKTSDKAKAELLKTAGEKDKVEENDKEEKKTETKIEPVTRQQVVDKAKQAQNVIATIEINPKSTEEYPYGTLNYTTQHSKNIKTIGLDYDEENRENKIKEALKVAYPEIDMESDEGKNLYNRYEYADPNIIEALKGNKKQLENYIDVFNQIKTKKDVEKEANKTADYSGILPDIKYDIRKLSKNKELSYEEIEEMENSAFNHRKMASVKKTVWQGIKFLVKGIAESIRNSRTRKALPVGVDIEPKKDGIDEDTSKKIKTMVNDKKRIQEFKAEDKGKDAEKKYKENAKKQDDEFKKKTDAWKVDNKDGHIEKNANKANKEKTGEETEKNENTILNDELMDMVNGNAEDSNTIILVDHKKENKKETFTDMVLNTIHEGKEESKEDEKERE